MQICDVISFEQMEQYFKHKKMLNIFEDSIILWLASRLEERELFFFLKDPYLSRNVEFLKYLYCKKIKDKYSSHQIARVAVYDFSGQIWYQINGREDSNFLLNAFSYFREGKDFLTLYEDERVKIVVFFLKMIGIFDSYDGKRHILQNGYYVSNVNESIILPYDHPYDYSYELSHQLNISSSKEYYNEQRNLLQKNLKRSLEFHEKLL